MALRVMRDPLGQRFDDAAMGEAAGSGADLPAIGEGAVCGGGRRAIEIDALENKEGPVAAQLERQGFACAAFGEAASGLRASGKADAIDVRMRHGLVADGRPFANDGLGALGCGFRPARACAIDFRQRRDLLTGRGVDRRHALRRLLVPQGFDGAFHRFSLSQITSRPTIGGDTYSSILGRLIVSLGSTGRTTSPELGENPSATMSPTAMGWSGSASALTAQPPTSTST